jgi:TonB family protein
MEAFINYILESNIALFVILLVYLAVFRNETTFKFARFFLLAGVASSICFPLLDLTNNERPSPLPTLNNLVPATWLPEVQIGAGNEISDVNPLAPKFSVWEYIKWIYFAGVIGSLAIFIIRLMRVLRLIAFNNVFKQGNLNIVEVSISDTTFSFFNYVFVGRMTDVSAVDHAHILRHESVHVSQWHSADILLVNLLKIVFWFNPLIWKYEKIFVQLHEFEADAHSAESHDVDRYCNLLARVALQSAGLSLGNHFNKSLTIKRIQMMRTLKHKLKNWKIAMCLAAFPLLFFFVACQDQISEADETSTLSAEVQERFEQFKKEYPGENFIVEYNKDAERRLAELESKYGHASHISNFTITTEDGEVKEFSMLQFSGKKQDTQEEIFTAVEKMPEFQNGMDGLRDVIAKNLRYSSNENVSGTVYVQFVVNKDGSVSDVRVLKGVNKTLDAEAVRVTSLLNKWTPGSQNGRSVRVRFVLPISFNGVQSKAEVQGIEESPLKMKIDWKVSKDGEQRFAEGIVTDENGNPLPGANILLTGTTSGVHVDQEGGFKIALPEDGNGSLAATFVGYETEFLKF